MSFSRSTLQSADCCPAGMTWTPVRGGNGGSRSFHTFFFAGGWKLLREFKDSELFLKTDCDLVVEDEVTASSSSCITVTPQYPTFHERLIWCICSCDRGSRPVTFNIGKIILLTQLQAAEKRDTPPVEGQRPPQGWWNKTRRLLTSYNL